MNCENCKLFDAYKDYNGECNYKIPDNCINYLVGGGICPYDIKILESVVNDKNDVVKVREINLSIKDVEDIVKEKYSLDGEVDFKWRVYIASNLTEQVIGCDIK